MSVFERLAILSEPLRVRILVLCEREELAVGELTRVLQTSQPTVSRHLKVLDDGGWVSRRKSGTAAYFRLAELGDAEALWHLVREEVEAEAANSSTVYAEDLRRLAGVLAARSGDSEELFRRLGERWDDVRRELFGDSYLLPALLSLLPPDQVVADLGCGTGAILPVLAPSVAEVIGIDREEAMLEVARQRTLGLGNVRLLRGLLDHLPLEKESLHLALCQLVLHHVRDLPPVFAEVARVLKPGGRWVILDMVEHDREEYRHTMGHQHLGFSQATLQELAGNAGLHLHHWRVLPADPAVQGPALLLAVLSRPS